MANLIVVNRPYNTPDIVKTLTIYALDPNKTGYCCGGQGVLIEAPWRCMEVVKKYYGQNEGKMIQHFILSFDFTDNISLDEAVDLGYSVCGLYPDYQFVFGVHINTDNLHIHWVMNPVNLQTGKKFNFNFTESYELRNKVAGLLEPYGISCSLLFNHKDQTHSPYFIS